MSFEQLLSCVPDCTSWEKARMWLEQGRHGVPHLDPTQEAISLEWPVGTTRPPDCFGLYADPNWRKFVLATFLADLVSYHVPADQVSFDRLLYVMHAFPEGFRTWWMQDAKRVFWPVGYSGWYPMTKDAFTHFCERPNHLESRMVVPTRQSSSYVYLFNFSVAPQLKNSLASNALMKAFCQDIKALKAKGLACITVSDDGIRVAKRFGMTLSGYVNESQEGVYVVSMP